MLESKPDRVKLIYDKAWSLKSKKEFDQLKERGCRWKSPFFTVLILSGPEVSDYGFGVICSRKFHKRAVVRNRARRLVRESFRLLRPELTLCRILVIPRREIISAGLTDVLKQFADVMKRAGLLQNFHG